MYQHIKILENNDKTLCLSTITDYTFASTNSQVPLAYYELFIASTTYPIMFTKTEDGSYNALALLSLKAVQAQHSFDEHYHPYCLGQKRVFEPIPKPFLKTHSYQPAV